MTTDATNLAHPALSIEHVAENDVLVVSTFDGLDDNKPKLRTTTWSRIVTTLTRHLHVVDKAEATLWSPARYAPGAIREKANVIDVSVLSADLDDGTSPDSVAYWLAGVACVISSTFSSAPEHPKLRIVVRLTEPIPVDEYDSVWRRANQHLFRGHIDPSTKDASRMYFLPSCPPDAQPIAQVLKGRPLDWRALPPLPPPQPVPKRSVANRPNASSAERRSDAMFAKWSRDLADMPEGGRHNGMLELARSAGGLVAKGLLEADTVAAVFFAAAQRNGLVADDGEHAVRRVIADGLEHGGREPWEPDDLPDSPAWMASHRFRRTARGVVDTDTGEILDESVLIEATTDEWPAEIAPGAFCGPLGDFVRGIQHATEADPAALLAHALSGASAYLGPDVFAIAGDARHPPRINAVVVGETSKARKGSSSQPILRVLRGIDIAFAARVTEGLSSGEGVIWQVRDAIEKSERVGRGEDRHTESVVVDAGVDDKRLWILETEFGSSLRIAGRDGNSLTGVIRRCWDSGDLRTLVKNNPLTATDAHVVVTGHCTKDELLRYLDRSELASGFGNRFLWIAARRGQSLPFGDRVPQQPVSDLSEALRKAREWTQAARQPISWDGEAREMWSAAYDELSSGKPGLLGAATNRAEAQTLRLAVLYAVVDRSSAITARHLEAALAVWEFAARSARWIFGDATGDPIADVILRTLRRGDDLSRNDLVNLFDRHVSSERLGRALGVLLGAGLAASSKEQDTGGRPREVWRAR